MTRGIMYIRMEKAADDGLTVAYHVFTPVVARHYINAKGKRRCESVDKIGYFVFSRPEKKLTFVAEKSDEFYIGNRDVAQKCLWEMLQCDEEDRFPEVVAWASG